MQDDAPRTAPEPELGWLHLDVATGCAGDMLCASLLDLGAPLSALRDGLLAIGLHPATGPRLTATQRNGVRALHLSFVDRHGQAIEGGPPDPPSLFVPMARPGKRRAPRPRRSVRPPSEDAAGGIAEETETDDAQVFTLHAQGGTPEASAAVVAAPDDVTRWLAGEVASGAELEARLARGRLPPVPAALSRKALRRLLEGLGQVNGVSRAEVKLDGPAAVDILADVVSFSCLLAALNPARVTASYVGVSTAQVRGGGGPEPWVVEVLRGVPTREREQAAPACTPTGAALVWAVTHQFGPRGASVVTRAGSGAGSRDLRGVANIVRALWGCVPQALDGDTRDLAASISPVGGRSAFVDALVAAGAKDLFFSVGADRDGNAVERLHCRASNADADGVTRVLLIQGGASSVVRGVSEIIQPVIERVPVGVGPDQKRETVDVVVTRVDGKIERVSPDPEQAQRAASRLGWEADAVRADARLAFERLSSEDAARNAPPLAPDETDS